jgi:hypothetical protein
MLRSGRVAVDGLGIGGPAHQPGNRSRQALGRPPGFHEQAAAGRSALDPPPDVTAPTKDHLTITHGSPSNLVRSLALGASHSELSRLQQPTWVLGTNRPRWRMERGIATLAPVQWRDTAVKATDRTGGPRRGS